MPLLNNSVFPYIPIARADDIRPYENDPHPRVSVLCENNPHSRHPAQPFPVGADIIRPCNGNAWDVCC